MPANKRKWRLEDVLWTLTILSFLAGILVLAFLHLISQENRAGVILVSSIILFSCLISFSMIGRIRQKQKKRRWQQVIQQWKENIHTGKDPQFDMARQLSAGALKQLAIQVYVQMGYRIQEISAEDERDIVLKLVNPEGQIELVHCFQYPQPVRLQQVRPTQLTMACENAVRAFIWAPGGFAMDALYWMRDKPIVFVDSQKIGHLIDCVLSPENT